MTPFAVSILGGIVRTLLGMSAGAGLATAPSAVSAVAVTDDMQALLSAVAAAITLAWSMYEKRKTAPLV